MILQTYQFQYIFAVETRSCYSCLVLYLHDIIYVYNKRPKMDIFAAVPYFYQTFYLRGSDSLNNNH